MPEASGAMIPFEQITNLQFLNDSTSKVVESGVWKGEKVAVLTLKCGLPAALEADRMVRLSGHPHLVKLLGQTRKPDGAQALVTEFAPHGALNSFLDEQNDEGVEVGERGRLSIALQVAMAMQRMGEEKLLHCDLAARNILVFRFDPAHPEQILVKVSDFGLSAPGASYYSQTRQAVPIRWMAPETHKLRKWHYPSDVWSFGVVLYEIWADGLEPYDDVADEDAVKAGVKAGTLRLKRPEGCKDRVWELIQSCTDQKACKRPCFGDIVMKLKAMMPSRPAAAAVQKQAAATPAGQMRALLEERLQTPSAARELELCPETREWTMVREMLVDYFKGRSKGISLRKVTRVLNPTTMRAFQRYTPSGDRHIEFKVHGTSRTAAAEIGKTGFKLPTEKNDHGEYLVTNGRTDEGATLMFGGGIYLTAEAGKAAAFTKHRTLIICAANLGKLWHIDAPDATLDKQKVLRKGFDSVHVPGGDGSQCAHDETVVYDPAAVLPMYTVQFCTTRVRTTEDFLKMKEESQESDKILALDERMVEQAWGRLRTPNDDICCEALVLLGDLCAEYDSASAWLTGREERVRAVVRQLRSGNEMVQWLALRVLANVTFRCPQRQAMLLDESALGAVCDLLRGESEAVKQKALVFVCNLYSRACTGCTDAEKEQRMKVVRALISVVGPAVGEMTVLYTFTALSNLVDSESGPQTTRLIAPLVDRLCKIFPTALHDNDWTMWVVVFTCNLLQSEYNSKTFEVHEAGVRAKLSAALVSVLERFGSVDDHSEEDIINKTMYAMCFYAVSQRRFAQALADAGAFSELVKRLPSARQYACMSIDRICVHGIRVPDGLVPAVLKTLRTLPPVAGSTADHNYDLARALLQTPDAELRKHGSSHAALQRIIAPATQHTYTPSYDKLKLDDDKCA